MKEGAANSPGLAELKPADKGWSRNRWLAIIALVFATHLALVYLFGEKKHPIPRAVANVPTLALAGDSDELLALNDPTLFALPHRRDFASAIFLNLPDVKPPSFRWTEPPRWLPLATESLGAVFGRLLPTNAIASTPPDFKPDPVLGTAVVPAGPMLAQNSTMQIEGALAQRQLPAPISLTNWPFADVLPPCVVQVLVDAAGNVASTAILSPSGYDAADQRALAIARTLHFTPSAGETMGRIIFNWHTVPPGTTANEHE